MKPRKTKRLANVKSHKTVTKDGEAEVFVLPPGVLQKLGINFNVIEDTQNQKCPVNMTTEADVIPVSQPACSINHNTFIEPIVLNAPVYQKESVIDKTILETANLMKKSVFLSPTFVGASDFPNPGELEIANTIEPQKHLITNGFHPSREERNKADSFIIDKLPFIIDQPLSEVAEIQCNYGSENMNLTVSNTTTPSQDQDLVTLHDILGEPTKLKPTDDHPDEAYLSDCSNSNSGSLEAPDTKNSIAEINSLSSPARTGNSKKIKIISEEILSPLQFEEMKKLLSPNVKVPANSVINSDRFIENVQPRIIENKIVSVKNNNLNGLEELANPHNTETVVLFNISENETLKFIDTLEAKDISTGAAGDVKFEYILQDTDSKIYTSANNLNVCIDFVVNDIDMHLKDDDTEATLENFVNEITSSDNNGIMKKIEESEIADTLQTMTKISCNSVDWNNINCNNIVSLCEKTEIKQNGKIDKTSKVNEIFTDQAKYNEKNIDAENTENAAETSKLCHLNSEEMETGKMDRKLLETSICTDQLPSEINALIGVIEFDKKDIKSDQIIVGTNFEMTKVHSKVMKTPSKEQSEMNIFKKEVHAGVNNTHQDKITANEDKLKKQTNETSGKIKVFETDKVNRKLQTHKLDSIDNSETVHSATESKTVTYEDKVKEIAMVLMQFAKTHSYFGSMRAESNTILKIPAKQSQSNPLKLKTHIQGVEKPGGSDKPCEVRTTSRIIKTYQKRNKFKPQTILQCKVTTPENEMHRDLTELDVTVNVNPEDIRKSLEFCLCGDFGSLAYYDSKIPYVHIHFWEHKVIDCNRDYVFSIYNNNESFNSTEENMDVTLDLVPDDSSKFLSYNICWHSFNINDEASDTILNECEVVEHANKHTFCWLCGKAPQFQKNNITINDKKSDVKEVQCNSLEIRQSDNDKQTGKERHSSVYKEKNGHDNANKEVTKAPSMADPNLASNSINAGESSSDIKKISNKLIGQNQKHENMVNEEESNSNNEPVKMNNPIKNQRQRSTIQTRDAAGSNEDKPKERDDSKVGKLSSTEEQSCKPCKNTKKSSHTTVMDVEVTRENISEPTTGNLLVTKGNEINREIVINEAASSYSKKRRAEACNKDNANKKKMKLINRIKDLGNIESADKKTTANEGNQPYMTENSSDTKQILCGSAQRKSSTKYTKGIDEAVIEKNMEPPNKKSTKCGVCDLALSEQEWEDHVSQKHCFIAWRSGTTLNFEDPELLQRLQGRIKQQNGLKCTFCDYQNKIAATFLQHARQCVSKFENKETKKRSCDIETHQEDATTTNVGTQVKVEQINEDVPNDGMSSNDSVQCGVCNEHVRTSEWMVHIAQKHHYIAWKYGDNPVDLANDEAIRVHLTAVVKEAGELKCPKCGVIRKQVIKYMQHVRNCTERLDPNSSLMDISINTKCSEGSADRSPTLVQLTKCGVCKQEVAAEEWINHIAQNHSYLAWKDGESPLDLDDEHALRDHLTAVLKVVGKLTCSKCGIVRKYVKKFNDHRKKCTGLEGLNASVDTSMNLEAAIKGTSNVKDSLTTQDLHNDVKPLNTEESSNACEVVTCGVCKQQVTDWIGHIAEKHNYIAWKEGESVINPEDTFTVQRYLNDLSKEINGLLCPKCGFKRKYAIPYLQHTKYCEGAKKVAEQNGVPNTSHSKSAQKLKCAVCQAEVYHEMWIHHIFDEHQYMAWQEGDSLDFNNQEEVETHLTGILEQLFYLQCYKCCSLHKDVSSYLKHVEVCKSQPNANVKNEKKLTCALCWKELDKNKWEKHRMDEHYNVAWYVGGVPVNFKNPNTVIQLIDEFKAQYKQLKCRLCGASRASAIGFYAHVVACNKTEQEIDMYKNVCDICDKKYFYFYHSQHMAWHTQQGLKAESIKEEIERQKVKEEVKEEVFEGRGGRKAAQKARSIIQKFKDGHEYQYKCSDCGFGADTNEDLNRHSCKGVKERDFSDSDESCKPDEESEESEDSDIDSNLSAEENEQTDDEDNYCLTPTTPKRLRERVSASSLIPRFPLRSTSKSLIGKHGLEFLEQHFICKNLFPKLRSFDCKPISDEFLPKYLPPLEESCRVQLMQGDWETLKRFEAKKVKPTGKGTKGTDIQILFVGGYIQCISWAPSYGDDSEGPQYLAVVGHCDVDQPRFGPADISSDPGLIQIWDFGDLKKPAEFVFGIAHDFGYVWAVDWCPSGARDSLPTDFVIKDVKRLGLLSVACANGSAYVFTVPYPSTVKQEDKRVYRLKPALELRLAMSSERTLYPATSISWTKQNGHQCIVVGYSDGTTAYYDLDTESPFLKTKENDRIVLFPYHDERLHNSCVTGLDTYPSLQEENIAGALCSSSVTGSCLMARPGVRPARQQIYSAIGDTQFQPFWPSSIIIGDEGNLSSSLNEVEWWGGGRRFGGGSAAAACWRCGQVALAPTPLLRVCYSHPVHRLKKGARFRETFGVIRMKPLSGKKRKLKNDDFQMKIEPSTYEDAILKYGLELRLDQEIIDQTDHMSRESFPEKTPERFPLCEVTSMAFCPTSTHHRKLAVATHAGVVFLITVRI